MRFDRLMVVLIAVTLPCSGLAQKAKEPTGGVTGHVLCGDTNLPARLASVLLQPVYEAIPPKPKSDKQEDQPIRPVISISQTMLDGSYTITGVVPGKYYVIVEKTGYLSPLAQLTREQLNKPDDAAAALIAKLLVPVTVTANHMAAADVRILRGGSIAGTVRFDDGSANGGGDISLMRKSKDGKWEEFHTGGIASFGGGHTDDEGHYRFTGLPAGEYLAKARINVNEVKMDSVFGDNHSVYYSSGFSLSIFPGGVMRTRDAKAVKLGEGEEADQVDVEIPVSKMHSISGSILDASGHSVNAGKVAIVYPDDDTELTSVEVSKDDGQFHLYFVPEGEYTLKVTDAKDVTREEIFNPPGYMPPSHTDEKTVREYSDRTQPIVIVGDMMGVTATVAAKKAAAPTQ